MHRASSRTRNQKRYDKQRYRHRNVIERFFGQLKIKRGLATRYKKKAANFTGFLWLAAVLPWGLYHYFSSAEVSRNRHNPVSLPRTPAM